MAELLGLAAGTFACITIIGSVTKDVNSLRRTIRRLKAAKKEIESFKDEVHEYGNITGLACAAIAPFEHIPVEDYNPVLQFMLEKNMWKTLVKMCENVEEDISKHVVEIRGLRGRSKFVAKLKWMSQRKEIGELGLRMNRVNSNLLVVLAGMQLYVNRSLPQTESSAREIKRLKSQIKKHVKTIRELEVKLDRTRDSVANTESAHKFASLIQNLQSALQEMGESMVYERCVPGHPPSQPSPTVSSISTESQARRSSTVNTSFSSFPTSERNRSNRSLPLSVAPLRTLRHVKHRGPCPVAREPEESPLVPKITENDDNGTHPPPAETIIIQPPNPDVFDISDTSNLVRLDLDVGYQAETICVNRANGLHHISDARLYKDLGVNLVTQNFVTTHSVDNKELFDMDDLAKKDEMWVQFGNGREEKCIGRVQFLWNTSVGNGLPDVLIDCWICVHGIDMMLGKPFAEQKQRYLTRGKRE